MAWRRSLPDARGAACDPTTTSDQPGLHQTGTNTSYGFLCLHGWLSPLGPPAAPEHPPKNWRLCRAREAP
eukprot:11156893-Alexandrium_andersonii.AAC.1